MKKYEFTRAVMRSHYRFTYNDLQAIYDRNPLSTWERAGMRASLAEPEPMAGPKIVANLYAAYKALSYERDHRSALDLNLPEYKILFDATGHVETIMPRVRLESHRLIEAYMIAANVAAADFLLKNHAPGIYRVHEPPTKEKLEELYTFLKMSGYHLQKGGIRAAHFNRVLKASEDKPEMPMIHTAVLRAQMQAYYSHENLGHFGLGLQKYCHFTSPIRRYADLVVHRALCKLVDSGLWAVDKKNKQNQSTAHSLLSTIALHISETERKAMMAERDATDRYKVSYMSKHIGNTFPGAISGLNEYGLYVTLSNTGVTGFVPVRNLKGDFYIYDKRHACFKGRRNGQSYGIGQPIIIRVQEANTMTGSLIFEPERPVDTPEPSLRPRHQHSKRRHKR